MKIILGCCRSSYNSILLSNISSVEGLIISDAISQDKFLSLFLLVKNDVIIYVPTNNTIQINS
jgi:hypothetical protein